MRYGQYMDIIELLPEMQPPHVQVLAPNFPQIDSDIDAREYSFDDGENSTDFKGFHRLERLLFRCAALVLFGCAVLVLQPRLCSASGILATSCNDCTGLKGTLCYLRCLHCAVF